MQLPVYDLQFRGVRLHLPVQPSVFEGDGDMGQNRLHRLDTAQNIRLCRGRPGRSQEGQYAVSLLHRNEVGDLARFRGIGAELNSVPWTIPILDDLDFAGAR